MLIYMRWYYQGPPANSFKLITSQTAPGDSSATKPPVLDFTNNEWAGKSIATIEAFALLHSRPEHAENLTFSLPVIVDEQGLRDKTCILMERVIIWNDGVDDDPTKGVEYPDRFNKLRLPWEQVWEVFANLDISNMDFEDYVDEEAGLTGDGCSKFNKEATEGMDNQSIAARDAALKALEDSGHA